MKNKSLLIIALLGLATSISACSLLPSTSKKESEEEAGDVTVYYLTRTYIDERDQLSSRAEAPTPTVLKFDYRKLKTYKYTADIILGDYAGWYGYHESYIDFGKLTVAIELEDDAITQYYLQFNKDGTAEMKKEKEKPTIDKNEGTLPNNSSKSYSEPGILDLGFEFTIDDHAIYPNCLFPETYFYCEYNYAIENNYNIQNFY